MLVVALDELQHAIVDGSTVAGECGRSGRHRWFRPSLNPVVQDPECLGVVCLPRFPDQEIFPAGHGRTTLYARCVNRFVFESKECFLYATSCSIIHSVDALAAWARSGRLGDSASGKERSMALDHYCSRRTSSRAYEGTGNEE